MTIAVSIAPHRAALPLLGALLGLAAGPALATDLVGLDGANRLVRFSDAKPGVTQTRLVKGTSARLVGIDVRPSNGMLYGLAADGTIYTLDAMSGQATRVSKINVAAAADATVVDFNPVADRMRVVTASGRSLRINVETGETVEDGKLSFAAGDANAGKMPKVTAGGYVNSTPGQKPATTALYEIDSGAKALVLQDPPNAGTLQTKAMLKLPGALRGLDVMTDASGKHTGIAVRAARLYRVDIASGQITPAGNIGKGEGNLIDVAALPQR